MLSNDEKTRYTRQLLIDDMGDDAQEKLKDSTVFIAGAGGLGSPVSLYLAAAGVGNIKICDNDEIELSNLNRQIVHNTDRIGMAKAESAGKSLNSLNPSINIEIFNQAISTGSINETAFGCDLLIDCLDNIQTRYVINQYSIENEIPIVHGGINGLAGQISFLVPGKTFCLKCLFPTVLEKNIIPVLGATAGVIGSLQALEAVKYLTGTGTLLENILLYFDGFNQSFERIQFHRDPECKVCGSMT